MINLSTNKAKVTQLFCIKEMLFTLYTKKEKNSLIRYLKNTHPQA